MRETSERDTARRTVAFFASVIKSGEPWSAACQDAYDATFRPLSEETAPTETCFCGTTMEVVRIHGVAVGFRCPECGQCVAGTSDAPLSSVAVEEPPAVAYVRFGDPPEQPTTLTTTADLPNFCTACGYSSPDGPFHDCKPPSVSVPREELDRARELFKQIGLQVQPKAETVLGSRCFELFSLLASWGTT